MPELPKCFQPSTPASRKAEQEARPPRTPPLISLGMFQRESIPRPGQPPQILEYELYHVKGRTSQLWIRYAGETAPSPVDPGPKTDKVLHTFTIPLRRRDHVSPHRISTARADRHEPGMVSPPRSSYDPRF